MIEVLSKSMMLVIAICAASAASAGTLQGVVQQLDGESLENVRIIVVDVTTGEPIASSQSRAGGAYTITFPAVVAVSITFDDGGVHEEAALIGVPGNLVARDFTIFMPDRKTATPHDKHQCCTPRYVPCCQLYHQHRYRRCWR